jgi:DnaJ-class molecular chaperone
MGSYQTCPKCKGINSKHYEVCSNCNGRNKNKKKEDISVRDACFICQDTGKRPCYSCDGAGKVYIGDKP